MAGPHRDGGASQRRPRRHRGHRQRSGLPKHNRNRLLEPTSRPRATRRTGLGLAIVLKSVDSTGGTLALEEHARRRWACARRAHSHFAAVQQSRGDPDVARNACSGDRQQQRMIAKEVRSDQWHLHPDRRREADIAMAGALRGRSFIAAGVSARDFLDGSAQGREERRPQLVILDIWLQGSRLERPGSANIIKAHPDLPVIIISGHGNIEHRGHRHQARRLRLHREALQGRSAAVVTLRALKACKLQRGGARAARALGRQLRARPTVPST